MGRAHPVYTKPTQFIRLLARRYVVAAFIAGLGPASVEVSAAVEAPVSQARWQMCIGRSPLSEALMQVARRIGVQVARLADVGSTNIVVGPVCGSFTREEALTAVLRGTGLTYRFVNDHTVAIIRQTDPVPAAPNSPPPTQLPPTSTPAEGGTDSVGNNMSQGGRNVGTVTDNSKHQNLLSRVLGLFAVCGVASLSPGHTCAQEATTSDTLQEVVVTAERRATDIQATPVSVTAISGSDLQDKHINVIGDLETQVPGLSVTNSGFTQNINIRGMGNSTASPTVTTGVPVYRDGLYQPEAILLTEPFYDIADVEILRGPQGTIVGQNSTGGALIINSANPNFNGVNGYAEVIGGNYSERKVDGAINLPVNDILAARVAFNIENRGSFFEDIGQNLGDASARVTTNPGSIDEKNFRVGLLFKPTDNFQALFKGEINELSTGGLTPRPLPPCSICAADSSFYQYGYNGPSIYNGFQNLNVYQLDYNTPEMQNDTADRFSLELRYILPGEITFRSLTGYQRLFEQRVDDADASAAPVGAGGSYWEHTIGPDPYLSQEFDLISPDSGKITWLTGASYFYRSTPVTLNEYPYGAPVEPNAADANTAVNIGTHVHLVGLFGQVGYQILPSLQLQVGARLSADGETSSGAITIPGPGIVISNVGTYSKSVPTGKVSLNWTPTDGQFVYGFVARGFKDGGINNAVSDFGPEYVNDYELGWKGEFLGGHFRTQLGGYYMQYSGMQQQVLNPDGGGNTVINLGNSKIEGLEWSAQGRLDNWILNAGVALNHSALGNAKAIAAYELSGAINTNLPQCATGQTAGCNNYLPYTLSLNGEANPYSPTFQGNISLSYPLALGGSSTLTPRVDYSYTGKQYASIFQNTDFYLLRTRSLVDVYLSYEYRAWEIQAFARNLTNEVYVAGIGGATGTAGSSGVDAFYGDPRTLGISVRTKF
jgi:iron complex outermembrane recepter protein